MAVSRMDVGRLVFVRMEPRNEFLVVIFSLLYTGVGRWKGGRVVRVGMLCYAPFHRV